MKPQLINRGRREVDRPDLLNLCIKKSESIFGWFTHRYPRVFEYTWVLEQLEKKKGYVCDVGSGVSPVPLILGEWGWNVYTVDYYQGEHGNEWGFVDYGRMNSNIVSLNMDFGQFDMVRDFDVVYSISAIEHMTRKNRGEVIQKIYDVLKEGGQFYGTVDLVRGTDMIWNKSGGRVIEEDHGTVDELFEEFGIFDEVWFGRQDGIKGVGTELLYIKCEK